MIPLHDDNPTTISPMVTIGLMVSCVLIFLWQRSVPAAVPAMGVIPAVLFGHVTLNPNIGALPAELTLITSMFLHGGWMHLIGNMLYLWIFGNNVEDAMGHRRYIAFYLLCGVIAALAYAWPQANSSIPMIGASGAISGVLGAYLMLYPHARVLVLIPLVFFVTTARIRAIWVLGFWFLLQLINSRMDAGGGGGVAWGAHVGGFAAGMLLVPLFSRKPIALLR